MLAKTMSAAVVGIDATLVEVEVDIAFGLPSFTTVGLPEAAVKESRERVRSAVTNSGYSFPDNRITVNLAPAHMRKEGTGFDLPIALGILAAENAIPADKAARYLIMGELSLDGRIKSVHGVMSMAMAVRGADLDGIIVPYGNRREASVAACVDVLPVKTLAHVVGFLNGEEKIRPFAASEEEEFSQPKEAEVCFSEVAGQDHAKRALEVAAAGGHNLIMVGPPGSGKTMLARRLSTILPPLTFEEALETSRIYSVVGMLAPDKSLLTSRPFRSPHHTISDAGLIGGGHIPRPGEVSLAHNGVLFLDELSEFKKHVLEVLRQPLEDGRVTISRAASTLTYPAGFMLVAAMNPCPCGYLGDERRECVCSARQIEGHRSRLSGPLMDRIDIHVEVPAVSFSDLKSRKSGESSQSIRKRVSKARAIQQKRFAKTGVFSNADMKNRHLKAFCRPDPTSTAMIQKAMNQLGLSARAYARILKIARTIADLEAAVSLLPHHVAEAIQYRFLDRKLF